MTKTQKYILVGALALVVILGFTLCGKAQSVSGFENYIGYQYTQTDSVVPNVDEALHGFSAGTTYFGESFYGATAELGASFNRDETLATALGGVTLKARRDKTVQPFVRGLAGISYGRTGCGEICAEGFRRDIYPITQRQSDFGFAWAVGGGVDVKLGKGVGLRLIQVDYLNTNHFGTHQNNYRVGTGLTF